MNENGLSFRANPAPVARGTAQCGRDAAKTRPLQCPGRCGNNPGYVMGAAHSRECDDNRDPVMNKATATATTVRLEVTAMTCGVPANGA